MSTAYSSATESIIMNAEAAVSDMLKVARTNMRAKIKTVEEARDMVEKLSDEAAKLNKCITTISNAQTRFERGEIEKDEMVRLATPCLNALKASCTACNIGNTGAPGTELSEEELAMLRQYIIGTQGLAKDLYRDLQNECCDGHAAVESVVEFVAAIESDIADIELEIAIESDGEATSDVTAEALRDPGTSADTARAARDELNDLEKEEKAAKTPEEKEKIRKRIKRIGLIVAGVAAAAGITAGVVDVRKGDASKIKPLLAKIPGALKDAKAGVELGAEEVGKRAKKVGGAVASKFRKKPLTESDISIMMANESAYEDICFELALEGDTTDNVTSDELKNPETSASAARRLTTELNDAEKELATAKTPTEIAAAEKKIRKIARISVVAGIFFSIPIGMVVHQLLHSKNGTGDKGILMRMCKAIKKVLGDTPKAAKEAANESYLGMYVAAIESELSDLEFDIAIESDGEATSDVTAEALRDPGTSADTARAARDELNDLEKEEKAAKTPEEKEKIRKRIKRIGLIVAGVAAAAGITAGVVDVRKGDASKIKPLLAKIPSALKDAKAGAELGAEVAKAKLTKLTLKQRLNAEKKKGEEVTESILGSLLDSDHDPAMESVLETMRELVYGGALEGDFEEDVLDATSVDDVADGNLDSDDEIDIDALEAALFG